MELGLSGYNAGLTYLLSPWLSGLIADPWFKAYGIETTDGLSSISFSKTALVQLDKATT